MLPNIGVRCFPIRRSDTAPLEIGGKIQTPYDSTRRSVCQNVCQRSRFSVDVLLSVGCDYDGSAPGVLKNLRSQTLAELAPINS